MFFWVQDPTIFIYLKKVEYDIDAVDYSIDLINGLFFLHTSLFLNFICYLLNWLLLLATYYRLLTSINFYTKTYYTHEEVKFNKLLEISSLKSFFILFFITLTGSWWAQQELNWNGLWSWDIIEVFMCIYIFIMLLHIHDLSISNYKDQILLPFIILITLLFVFLIRYGLIITRHDFVDFNRVNQKTNYIIKIFIISFVFLLSYYTTYLKKKIKLTLNNGKYKTDDNRLKRVNILPFSLIKKNKEMSYLILFICIKLIVLLPMFKITFESIDSVYSVFFDLSLENISVFVIMLFSLITLSVNSLNPTVLYFNSKKVLYKNIFFKNIYNLIFNKVKKPLTNKVKNLFLFNKSTKIKVIHFSSFFFLIIVIIDNTFNTDFRVVFKSHLDNVVGNNQFFQVEFKNTPSYLQIRLEDPFLGSNLLFSFFDNFLLRVDSFKLRKENYPFDSIEKVSIYYSNFNIVYHTHMQYPLFISSVFYETGLFFIILIILLSLHSLTYKFKNTIFVK